MTRGKILLIGLTIPDILWVCAMKLKTSREPIKADKSPEKPVSKGWEKTVHQLDNAIHIHPVADLIQHEV